MNEAKTGVWGWGKEGERIRELAALRLASASEAMVCIALLKCFEDVNLAG